MTTARSAVTAALGALLALAACRPAPSPVSREAALQRRLGLRQRPCTTPAAGFRDPTQANPQSNVSAFMRARARDQLPHPDVQTASGQVIADGSNTQSTAWAVPALCADAHTAAQLNGGRLLGFVTTDKGMGLYGLGPADTGYVWVLQALSPGVNTNGALLVIVNGTDAPRYRRADIDYHAEGNTWDKAYASLTLIPLRALRVGAAPTSQDIFRLASFAPSTVAMQDSTTGGGNTSAWYTCLTGCCRVIGTREL